MGIKRDQRGKGENIKDPTDVFKPNEKEQSKKHTKDILKRFKKKTRKIMTMGRMLMVISILTIVIASISLAVKDANAPDITMSWGDFQEAIENNEVATVQEFRTEGYAIVDLKDGSQYTIVDPGYEEWRKDLLNSGVDIRARKAEPSRVWIQLLTTLPLQLILILLIAQMMQSAVFNTENMFKTIKGADVVKFDQVAGMTETKKEVQFAIEQLKHYKELESLGARPCKGIIFEGPPGTGKTLLAKAIAGESGVPLISCSGSDFVQMFVGMGAARIRSLWNTAELNAPCIIFIDEIDCLGRRRNGGSNSENNQTLNALLQKMDGLGNKSGIFVIGATNRISDLDQALLRPGRFDKHLYVGPPRTKKDRDEVIAVHLKNKKLSPEVNIDKISRLMYGMSGAEIEEVLNEAVMQSLIRGGEGTITVDDIDKASMKLISNGVLVKHSSERDRWISAIHEAGHAVMTCLNGDKVAKVSIESYSSGVGGYTMENTDSKENQSFMLKSQIYNQLKVLLAGMVSEDLEFNEHSTGCSNDLERASVLAYNYLNSYGMEDVIVNREALKANGMQLYDNTEVNVVDKLLHDIKAEVGKALRENKPEIDRLAKELIRDDTVLNYEYVVGSVEKA